MNFSQLERAQLIAMLIGSCMDFGSDIETSEYLNLIAEADRVVGLIGVFVSGNYPAPEK